MAETTENNGVKKSPKKLIIIILSAVCLIGAGVGGFIFMKKGSNPEHTEGDKQEKHESDEHKAEETDEENAEPEVYYDLPNPLVVDFPSGAGAKVIKVSLTVLVKGEAGAAALKKHEPMVRNNLLMLITTVGAEKLKTTEGKQELRMLILSEIGKILEKMAGKNAAKDVYFTEFVMQ